MEVGETVVLVDDRPSGLKFRAPHLAEKPTMKTMNLKGNIERARTEAKEREAKRPSEPTKI
jgi:hypothetical protein